MRRWNVAEEFLLQAIDSLESAKVVAAEALKIENLPEYVTQHIRRLMGKIERVTGGVQPWNNQPHPGGVRTGINRVRQSMPAGAIEEARAREKRGVLQPLA